MSAQELKIRCEILATELGKGASSPTCSLYVRLHGTPSPGTVLFNLPKGDTVFYPCFVEEQTAAQKG